jgi:glutathione-regulated potassium-efflux system ancillary protein KefF
VIAVIYAHPYPLRSRANRALLNGLADIPELDVRSLYDLYPDFAIDVEAEQAALLQARIVLWLCPLYWYSPPALLKLWFEKVLTYGWAYGEGAQALRGKYCRWIVTAGGDEATYSGSGVHGRAFEQFVAPVEQTALFCQMRWESPFVMHGARRLSHEQLHQHVRDLRQQVSNLMRKVSASMREHEDKELLSG